MLRFRHSVTLLKEVCNFPPIHTWIRWTTWNRAAGIYILQYVRLYICNNTVIEHYQSCISFNFFLAEFIDGGNVNDKNQIPQMMLHPAKFTTFCHLNCWGLNKCLSISLITYQLWKSHKEEPHSSTCKTKEMSWKERTWEQLQRLWQDFL